MESENLKLGLKRNDFQIIKIKNVLSVFFQIYLKYFIHIILAKYTYLVAIFIQWIWLFQLFLR